MITTTLHPNQPSTAPIRPNRQGRSKKQLQPVVTHDGRVFIARYEGRPGRVFGSTIREAQNNLKVSGQ
jgi:hypothetical protein